MIDLRVNCPVVFCDDERFGTFANAFRVLLASPDEVVMDFCVYSPTENVARVVSRVRVSRQVACIVDARVRDVLNTGGTGEVVFIADGGALLPLGAVEVD